MIYGSFLLLSCGTEPKERATTVTKTADTTPVVPASVKVTATDTDNSFAKEAEPKALPVAPPLKSPSGVYRFLLPYEDGKILHTIEFYPGTYKLQEEYPGKKDSIVITEGTWAPSTGYIWIYKDQIARGRYTWNGDALQYYSPRVKKNFAMEKLTPVTVNEVWQTKRSQGELLHGVGTEPFWSIDVTHNDTLVLSMPELPAPVRLKITGITAAKDSTLFTAANDSLRLVVYPLFCSDGMSDFLYTRRLKMVYKGQTYKGCGEMLAAAH